MCNNVVLLCLEHDLKQERKLGFVNTREEIHHGHEGQCHKGTWRYRSGVPACVLSVSGFTWFLTYITYGHMDTREAATALKDRHEQSVKRE